MSFVIIEKNKDSVPSDPDIKTAMTGSKGTVTGIEGGNAKKRVDFTGSVNHTTFENTLIQVAGGKRNSWNFAWADAAGLDAAAQNGVHAAAAQYGIDIDMPPATVQALQSGNYSLYAFKAVKFAQWGAAPLVWSRQGPGQYSTRTQVAWEARYFAYSSTSGIIPNGKVTASASLEVQLGQTVAVRDGGYLSVSWQGPPQAISFNNGPYGEFTCGISQLAGGSANPVCAFPMMRHTSSFITPVEKVLLMFSAMTADTGTVIERSPGPGVLVDLTGSNKRAVSYDINKGWAWGGSSWGRGIAANESLGQLLIDTSFGSGDAADEPAAEPQAIALS